MADQYRFNISSTIALIDAEKSNGVPTLDAIVNGITKGFGVAGAAILILDTDDQFPQIIAHHFDNKLLPNIEILLKELKGEKDEKKYLNKSVRRGNFDANRDHPHIDFLMWQNSISQENPVGTLILWNDTPISTDTAALDCLALIGLSIDTFLETKEKSVKDEEQTRDILELNPDAIIVQADGVPVYLNQRAVEIFAADNAASILNRPSLDFAHPDEREAILSYRNEVISEGIPSKRFETKHVRMDGSVFHSEMNIGKISWKGRPGTINIIRDITARKKAEMMLLQREKEQALAQKLGRMGHWRLSLETNELEWSDELFNIYGLDRDTTHITSELAHSMKPAKDVDAFNHMIEKLQNGEQATDFDYRILRNDGELRILRGNIRPDFDSNGKIISVFGVTRDVTEQKQLEKARDASNARFKDLAELGADWFWEMDEDLRFSFFSDRLQEITGVSTEHYIGKTRAEMRKEAEADSLWDQHLDDLKNHRPFKNFRYTHASENGVDFQWTISGKPIYDQEGIFIGYRGTGTDITVQTLTEEKLGQSQKMEAVGQLTGGIAHDFNNLLAVIQGNAELLMETSPHLTGKEEGFINSILKSADRGAELTQSMLAFSRKQDLIPKTIYLDKQIQGMTKILSRTLGETISIKVIHENNLWACTADPGQMENALLNLAINARDAMPDGGNLSIETQNIYLDDEYAEALSELVPGKYLMLAVSDTGTGISAEDMEHVFEPFFTTKDVGSGTGLGLSMVYGFAKQSGGHASIYSEVGKGTTVKIYLPQTDHVEKEQDKIEQQTFKTGNGVILVVEDDPDMRSLTVALLNNMGYQVQSAKDGPTALSMLEDIGQLDVLLSDIVLPGGLNGVELAKEIKEIKPDIKTLFMSGYTENAFSQSNILQEDAILLEKPFRQVQLAEKISYLLNRKA